MSYFGYYSGINERTEINVNVAPDQKEPTVTITGYELINSIGDKVDAYFVELKAKTLVAERERAENRKKHVEDEARKDDERKAKIKSMEDELKQLADTFERPASFWLPEVNADDAMFKAKDLMRKRNPRFFDELDRLNGVERTAWGFVQPIYKREYYDRPYLPCALPWFERAKAFINTARQFPDERLSVPVSVISNVVEWKPDEENLGVTATTGD